MQTTVTPTWAQIIHNAHQASLMDLRVCLPGVIQAYAADKQTVDVQLKLKKVLEDADGNLVEEAFPLLSGIPLMFPRGGGFFVSFPHQVGDSVLVLFCDFSIDQWRSKAADSDPLGTAPIDLTPHALNGAIAIPGFYPSTSVLDADPEDMVIGMEDGGRIYINGTEINIWEKNATEFVALGLKSDTRFLALEAKVNALIASHNLMLSSFDGHTHGGVQTGLGTTAPSTYSGDSSIPSLSAGVSVQAVHVRAS